MATTTTAKEQGEKWSQAVNPYVKYFEPSTLSVGRFMLNCMKLQFQDHPLTILETGAGGGGLAKELLALNGLSLGRLHITDIAEGMLEKCRERLEGTNQEVTIESKDFTRLDGYGDGSMDRYYANMVLCYAEDPVLVVKETYRVLKTGGIAGFTIWGREDRSPVFTIVPDVLDELGLVKKGTDNKRSSFH